MNKKNFFFFSSSTIPNTNDKFHFDKTVIFWNNSMIFFFIRFTLMKILFENHFLVHRLNYCKPSNNQHEHKYKSWHNKHCTCYACYECQISQSQVRKCIPRTNEMMVCHFIAQCVNQNEQLQWQNWTERMREREKKQNLFYISSHWSIYCYKLNVNSL